MPCINRPCVIVVHVSPYAFSACTPYKLYTLKLTLYTWSFWKTPLMRRTAFFHSGTIFFPAQCFGLNPSGNADRYFVHWGFERNCVFFAYGYFTSKSYSAFSMPMGNKVTFIENLQIWLWIKWNKQFYGCLYLVFKNIFSDKNNLNFILLFR